jgi:hypothetical protein
MIRHVLNQWRAALFGPDPLPLGPENLIRAAELHMKLGLGTLSLSRWTLSLLAYHRQPGAEGEVIYLARADDVEPRTDAERQALIARLRQFPTQTLKALLPVAIHARRVL